MPGCDWRALDEFLTAPVTRSDREADERRDQREKRIKAMLRGEIPQ